MAGPGRAAATAQDTAAQDTAAQDTAAQDGAQDTDPASPPPADGTDRTGAGDRLDELRRLLEEVVDDNIALVARLDAFERAQTGHAGDTLREIAALRSDVGGAVAFRALRDLCTELVEPLGAIDDMLDNADFADPAATERHVRSLSLTLSGVLSRMGAEKVSIDLGAELFDPARHRCARVVGPDDSPFPSALPRTVVRVLRDGYLLHDRPLTTAVVEIQAEREET